MKKQRVKRVIKICTFARTVPLFPEGYARRASAYKSLAGVMCCVDEKHKTETGQLTTASTRAGFSAGASTPAG
jgi:hypothetical protein